MSDVWDQFTAIIREKARQYEANVVSRDSGALRTPSYNRVEAFPRGAMGDRPVTASTFKTWHPCCIDCAASSKDTIQGCGGH